MKSQTTFLLFLVFSFSQLVGQNSAQFSNSAQWSSDSTIFLQGKSTNYGNPFLAKLSIEFSSNGVKSQIFELDSVYIGKGISLFKKQIELPKELFNPYENSISAFVQYHSVVSSKLLWKGTILLPLKKKQWATVKVQDSSITISELSKPVGLEISSSQSNEEVFELLGSVKDTTIVWHQIIKEEPFKKRKFKITQQHESGEKNTEVIYYEKGHFSTEEPLKDTNNFIRKQLIKKENLALTGSIEVESNFFSKTPQHSNGSQYPYTMIRASNTVSILGIPFTVNAFHSTNDNISPNFRNFFSLSFDANSFRQDIQQQLLNDELDQIYPSGELNADILQNEIAIKNLKEAQEIIKRYPGNDYPIDSLYSEEMKTLNRSIQKDSMYQLDSSLIDTSQLKINDSSLYEKENDIAKLQRSIELLEQSNRLKKQYLGKVEPKGNAIPQALSDPKNLFQKFDGGGLTALLLRFEKLQIGNFYEYAGEYSIRDVEMKGFNTTLLLNPTTQLNFLYGKINNFQSFNLDEITDRKTVVSGALLNTKYDYFQPSIRVTQFEDNTINTELNTVNPKYYVLSAKASGSISSYLYYETEVNRSNEESNPLKNPTENLNQIMAYHAKATATPFQFLDVKLQYDQVGSNYRSDGVYFLNRNTQQYTVGYKLRLFKNKIHLRNDYAIINRNFENKELINQTKKLFFDAGTHFKRMPNLQVSYSPISVEIANRLDTSFSGIDGNTNVLIARLHYFKKVKKTIISTALIYNEIENELAENFSEQKGIQHFASISNEKITFSFTSSYNEVFSSVRFISSSYAQQISPKLTGRLSVAKNFANHFYSEIIRNE